jgi:Helix-turn-helix domain
VVANKKRNHTMNNSESTATTPPQGALKMRPAAEYLGGLSKATMLRLVKRGLLRPCRKTRHLLFSVRELDRFLSE